MRELGRENTRPQNRDHRVRSDLIAVYLQARARKVERFSQPGNQQTGGAHFRARGQHRTGPAARPSPPDEGWR